MTITEEIFIKATGAKPDNDDLDRCNCQKAGQFGHFSCGWCERCKQPRFSCGHYVVPIKT